MRRSVSIFAACTATAGSRPTLREWLLGITRTSANFLRLMAENALQARPPLGLWRDFATEDAPERAEHDQPQALRRAPLRRHRAHHGARARPAADVHRRAAARGERGRRDPRGRGRSAVASFFFVQEIRLRHQAALETLTDEAANRIDPARLNELDRRTLKEAFRIARELQSRLALDYQL